MKYLVIVSIAVLFQFYYLFPHDQLEFKNLPIKGEYKFCKVISTFLDDSSKIIAKYYISKMIFNDNGYPIESIDFKIDSTIARRTIYKYDVNWKVILETTYDENDSIINQNRYKYNSKGKLIELIWVDGAGDSIDRIQTYIYDNNDNLIETSEVLSDGKIMNKINYTFDKDNNLIRVSKFDGGLPASINEIIYFK